MFTSSSQIFEKLETKVGVVLEASSGASQSWDRLHKFAIVYRTRAIITHSWLQNGKWENIYINSYLISTNHGLEWHEYGTLSVVNICW